MNKLILVLVIALFTTPSFSKIPRFSKNDPLPANLFVELAKAVNPSVVNISTTYIPKQKRGRRRGTPSEMFFEEFFGGQRQNQKQPKQSLGTGFIIREDGLILTNNHVVAGADVIKVQLTENAEKLYEAKIIGQDAKTDIALIKIEIPKKLPKVTLGSSSKLEVGEWVAAFGNPFGHGHSVTKGIISAKGRKSQLNRFRFLQTDASINPGNSGGPLVNTRGEVVGVNSAVDARAQGIGFAIPIDDVKPLLEELEKNGVIKRGFIGINLADIGPRAFHGLSLKTKQGSLVVDLVSGGPAAKAGLNTYDVIVELNGETVKNSNDLINAVLNAKVGSTVSVKVNRNGKILKKSIKISRHPDDKKVAKKQKVKSYRGQKAPFNFGFKISKINRSLQQKFDLPRFKSRHPVITEVTPGSKASKAGLSRGDVILDINKRPVTNPKDVIKTLKNGVNILRVLKGEYVVLIQLD